MADPTDTAGSAGQDRVTDSAARQMVPCPECDNGRVFATFVYSNGDSVDIPAECPYCDGAGIVLASAVPRV